jgi:hypothetical protein
MTIALCIRHQQFREGVTDCGHTQPPHLPSVSSPR